MQTLREWIEYLQTTIQSDAGLVSKVKFCYRSRQDDHFTLLSLIDKDQTNQYPQFSSLRHNVARLGEHVKTVENLVAVRDEYPELLDASITPPISSLGTLPSPNLSGMPLAELVESTISIKKDRESCYSALQVITNCFSEQPDSAAYIRSVCERAKSTRVHAELVLLDWFRLTNSRFLADDRFIGCSKDACYSCDRYVQALAHKEKVDLRGCHNKIYLAWRPPDIPSESGYEIRRRQDLQLQRFMGIVRSDLQKQLQRSDRRTWHFDTSTGITTQVSAVMKARWQAALAARTKPETEDLIKSISEKAVRGTYSGESETTVEAGAVDPDLPELESDTCSNCSKPASQRCSVCQITYYCSRVCQSLEWKHFHGTLCKAYKGFQKRPSSESKRALLFPVDSRDPRWIWVPVEWQPPKDGEEGWEMAKLGDLLGTDDRIDKEHHHMTRNPRLKRPLTKTIHMIWRDNFMNDGSPFNLSIAKITQGDVGHRWGGPIVILAMEGLGSNPTYYSDLEITDIRDVVDYFADYNQESVEVRSARGPDEVPGVQISCVGDMETFGYEKFTTVAVPPRGYTEEVLSSVSRRVGFPLLLRKYPPDVLWQNSGESAYENILASWLLVGAEPYKERPTGKNFAAWGWIPFEWKYDVGSVIVTRANKGPLSPFDVEVMCNFCFHHLQPLFEESMAAGSTDEAKAKVLAEMTREKYRQYREQYSKEDYWDQLD